MGNQAFGGSLGMDFNVIVPVRVTDLGVFDSGSNGLALPITARLYDRATQSQVATIAFSPGDGALMGGSRFAALGSPITLPAGFQGTIVAEGYGGAEPNGNGGGVPFAGSTTDGGGALSFVGSSRFGAFGRFPGSVDGGPANRYAAGTFAFGDVDTSLQLESSDKVAYLVLDGTVGNQAFGGSLGMDFDVNEPIQVTQLGVFDSAQDGLNATITAHLYDRDNPGSPLATLTFSPGDDGVLDNGSRFKDLPSILELPAGFHGTIVAEGYGAAELLGNEGVGDIAITTNNGGGLLSFVGSSRFGTAGLFPGSVDGGPANRYAAGTFRFQALPAIPEPATAGLMLVALAGVVSRRRRGRAC